MMSLFTIFPGCLLLIALSFSTHAAEITKVSIGVLAFRGEAAAIKRWSATADYLSHRIPGHEFEIRVFDLESMEIAVADRELDFILTNPGQYVTFEVKYGASRMVTMQTICGGENYSRFGSAVIARADRKDLQNLADLKGKHLMAVAPTAFGGYQLVWRELKELGISPEDDLSGLTFSGFPQDNIAISVLNGDVDAGVVRTSIVERMIAEGKLLPGQINVLSPRKSEIFVPEYSTRLYPEWPFAKLKHTPIFLAKQVARNLLAMAKDDPAAKKARILGWTIPLDYTSVHEMLRELRIGPYVNLGKVSIQDIFREHALTIFAVMLALLFLTMSVIATKNANRRLIFTRKKLEDHRRQLKQEVASQTEELQQVNKSLRKDILQREKAENTVRRSRKAIQSLYEIAVDYDRDHEEKLNDLIALGRRHYNMEAGLLYEVGHDEFSLCILDGDSRYTKDVAHCLKGLSAIDDAVEISPEHGHCNGRCLLAFPVVVHGRVCCVLAFVGEVEGESGSELDKVDKDFLLLMASWIGSEMEYKDATTEKELHKARLTSIARLNTMGQMASELAHELNQPLTAAQNYIGGGLRLMRQGVTDTDELLVGMEKALEGVNRATDVIRHLRQVVKTGVPSKDWFKFNDAVGRILEMLESNASQSRVKIENLSHDSDVMLWGDAMQIEQVLLNLVRNALEATPPDGKITILTECANEFIRVSVEDQGSGINTEEDESVFDPFYTTKAEGMGLGLSICRAIIEMHDGRIWAHNNIDGACFTFELPIGENGEQLK